MIVDMCLPVISFSVLLNMLQNDGLLNVIVPSWFVTAIPLFII
ncbi:Sensory box sigma-54 dependent DNA-binding response regulator [Bacillus cereus Rock3-44]|nr:Sensory box sigma-54 dependent DNA-binding response regulator [Bacillus cereus Rock3-44]